MKRRLQTLAIAATTLIAVGAHAQGVYGEVGYSQFNLKQDSRGFDAKVKPTAARAIVGVELAPHLANPKSCSGTPSNSMAVPAWPVPR